MKISTNSDIPQKNGPMSALEALQGRFESVFDINTVLQYNFADFFDFCRYLGYYGYKTDGFDGRLQAPGEFVRHHLGNCWDQTELQREWFNQHSKKTRTFLLYYYLSDDFCPSHSILTYQEDGKCCWFEPMCYGKGENYIGIHEYSDENALLSDFRTIFERFGRQTGTLPGEMNNDKWSLYRYDQPRYGISDVEFYQHCQKGDKYEF